MIAELFAELPEARTPTGSHLPALGKALDHAPWASSGAILELGMGNCSTFQLHEVCRLQGWPLYSYETDPAWAERFMPLRTNLHDLVVVKSYDEVPIESMPWAVALVDHGPGARRNVDIVRLKDHAALIVCHDSEPEHAKCYRYFETLPEFKYRWDYKPHELPWTAVVSNHVDVGRWI